MSYFKIVLKDNNMEKKNNENTENTFSLYKYSKIRTILLRTKIHIVIILHKIKRRYVRA